MLAFGARVFWGLEMGIYENMRRTFCMDLLFSYEGKSMYIIVFDCDEHQIFMNYEVEKLPSPSAPSHPSPPPPAQNRNGKPKYGGPDGRSTPSSFPH